MVCLCGRVIANNLQSLLDARVLTYAKWAHFPTVHLEREIYACNTFRSMVESLRHPDAERPVNLLRTRFLGFLGDVLVDDEEEDLADFLTSEGVLSRPHPGSLTYRMTSLLVDGLLRRKVIAYKFRNIPPGDPPFSDSKNSLDVLSALTQSFKCFDKQLIRLAADRSFKVSNVKVGGFSKARVPRESVYDTELMRILTNWLRTHQNWTVTGQWHLKTPHQKHKYTDIVLQESDNPPTVLELLATGDQNFVNSHIEKTPEYMTLLKADVAWVIHFTREDNYVPVWQSNTVLDKGVNVVHFYHNSDFTEVTMMARWKDQARVLHTDTQTISI